MIDESRQCVSCLLAVCMCVSCQFVVRDGYDYAVHAVDPDTLVEWDRIEQVVSWLSLLVTGDMSP